MLQSENLKLGALTANGTPFIFWEEWGFHY